MHLYKWTARRAGGRITINGVNSLGQPRKLVGVDTIMPDANGKIIATDKLGEKHELVA